jgi:hypothetical protein
VELVNVQLSVSAPATVFPLEQANIASRITAPIEKLHVRAPGRLVAPARFSFKGRGYIQDAAGAWWDCTPDPVVLIPRSHCGEWDGSGYPDQLREETARSLPSQPYRKDARRFENAHATFRHQPLHGEFLILAS